MDLTIFIYLSSGLFLGWSLGANDAANVFGTAVGTRMVKFITAAVICSVFLMLGAVIDGAGAAHTLGKLGSVNALGGSFVAAFSAALTVYWMTKWGLPVSTSQAIVGAIIGWNLFSGAVTDMSALSKIVGTWVSCPLLAGVIAVPLYKITEMWMRRSKLHLLRLDAYTRVALILAGAFGSYALGANNIANVMGVFVSSSPFTSFDMMGLFTVTGIQQLFFLGAVAIGVGVITYSKRVMMTVGGGLMSMTPVGAWVVVVSHSIVLYLFASENLEHFLASHGLPTFPLVPVSSSQAVIGAVIGIGLSKGGRGIKWSILGRIGGGWVSTPIISAIVCFFMLFFVQNVFNQRVFTPQPHLMTFAVQQKLATLGVQKAHTKSFVGKKFETEQRLKTALNRSKGLTEGQISQVLHHTSLTDIYINPARLDDIDPEFLDTAQIEAVKTLSGNRYRYEWQLEEALGGQTKSWQLLPATKANKLFNKTRKRQIDYIERLFTYTPPLAEE